MRSCGQLLYQAANDAAEHVARGAVRAEVVLQWMVSAAHTYTDTPVGARCVTQPNATSYGTAASLDCAPKGGWTVPRSACSSTRPPTESPRTGAG